MFWVFTGGGTVLIAFLKKIFPEWADYLKYSVGTFASLAIIFVAVQANVRLGQEESVLTVDHTKETITEWLQKDSASSTRELSKKEAPDYVFAIWITSPSGTSIAVDQTKEYPREIHITATTKVNPQALMLLSKRDTERLYLDIIAELAKEGMSIGVKPDLSIIHWDRTILLASNIREEEFLRQIDTVERSSIVVETMLKQGIANGTPQPAGSN